VIKNLFELKNARRVIVDGNVLEYNWEESQTGFAVLLTVRNQDGQAPWSVVEDVQFINNIVRRSGSGINLLGHDNNQPRDQSQKTKRILIRNNVWDDIGGARWGGKGILFQLLDGTSDVAIEHNTAFQTGFLIYVEGQPHMRFRFQGNVAPHNEYGIFGSGVGVGTKAIEAYFPQAVVVDNVIAGGDASQYPVGNSFPLSLNDVPVKNEAEAGGSRLASTGGKTEYGHVVAGADFGALCRALGPQAAQESLCRKGL